MIVWLRRITSGTSVTSTTGTVCQRLWPWACSSAVSVSAATTSRAVSAASKCTGSAPRTRARS